MTSVNISDPQGAIQAHQAVSATEKRNRILLLIGFAALLLGGVGVALGLTVFKSKSESTTSSDQEYGLGYEESPEEAALLASAPVAALTSPLVPLPPFKDWTSDIGAVRDQGLCGASWAFAAVAGVETAFFRRYKSKITLSPQQLIDCQPTMNNGCGGGPVAPSWDYFKKFPAVPEFTYPYQGRKQTVCTAQPMKKGVAKVFEWQQVTEYPTGFPSLPAYLKKEQEVMQYVFQHGPVIALLSGKGWRDNYKGGIATQETLGCNRVIDHAVQIVGFGVQNGQKFWKIRNSFGTTWGGEGGFMRLAMGANHCCVLCRLRAVSVLNHIPEPNSAMRLANAINANNTQA